MKPDNFHRFHAPTLTHQRTSTPELSTNEPTTIPSLPGPYRSIPDIEKVFLPKHFLLPTRLDLAFD
jgi:hypothetical protein